MSKDASVSGLQETAASLLLSKQNAEEPPARTRTFGLGRASRSSVFGTTEATENERRVALQVNKTRASAVVSHATASAELGPGRMTYTPRPPSSGPTQRRPLESRKRSSTASSPADAAS